MLDRVAADRIAAEASKLRWATIETYRVQVVPKSAPNLAAGAKLYQSLCAACHEADSKGDGPAGAKLEPAPSNFHDANAWRRGAPTASTTRYRWAWAAPAYTQLSGEERWPTTPR